MKRYYILAMMVATSVAALAQDYTYAERFGRVDPQGSARSQAMGGAFGALGADMTSSAINPAGFGVYRASELGMTLGVNTRNIDTSTPLSAVKESSKDTHLNLLQIGGVLSAQNIRQESGIVGHSFAVTYNQLADYDAMYTLRNNRSRNSLLDYFVGDRRADNQFEAQLAWDAEALLSYYEYDQRREDANGNPILDSNNNEIWDTYHIDVDHNMWEYPYETEDGIAFDPQMRTDVVNKSGNINVYRHFNDRGEKGEFALNYAQNIANKLFWGVKMGVVSHEFKREMYHEERFGGEPAYDNVPNYFYYHSTLKQEATGFALGAGVIYVPVQELRLGLAVHAPTFYSTTDITESSFRVGDEDVYLSPINEWSYRYTAPARVVFSAAGVIGRLGIISADYEFEGMRSSKFRNSEESNSEDQFYEDLSEDVRNSVNNVHKIRLGAEIKPIQMLALRGGYKMQTSPYSSGILDTKYKNRDISGGIGLRFSNVYVDLSYVNSLVKDEAWILPDSSNYEYDKNPKPSSVETKTHRVSFTIGYRF